MTINKEDLLTQEKLKELLHYNPDTGLFTWRERVGDSQGVKMFNGRFAGTVAGHVWHTIGGLNIIGK